MKHSVNPNNISLYTLAAGIVGLLLRIWLYATGVDAKGLLTAGHIAGYLIWVLTAVVLVFLILCTRLYPKTAKYTEMFPPFLPGAFGSVAAAIGVLTLQWLVPGTKSDIVSLIVRILSYLACVSLVILGWCRLKGRRPMPLFPCVIIVYFMFHLISQYRQWSSVPQLQDSCFLLLASLFLMLTSFHRAELTVNTGSVRRYMFFNQISLYFCCVSLFSASSQSYLFYLTMAAWLLTDTPQLPVPAAREEA